MPIFNPLPSWEEDFLIGIKHKLMRDNKGDKGREDYYEVAA